MKLCGFLFLLIIVLSVLSEVLGNKIISDLDSGARLQKINDDPKKFKISVLLMLIHNISIIAIVVMLFIVFSPYNLILGVVWTIFRIGEALILFYNENNYWGLLNIARQYSDTSGAEKNSLSDLARTILKTKESRFKFAQILFSIGTIAYSILFLTEGVVPPIIVWLGIIARILFGFGYFKVLSYFGGFLVMFFEVILGGWLLFFV